MQPRTLLALFAARAHCNLMSDLVSTRTPQSFSEDLFSSHPRSVLVAGVIPPIPSRTWHFLLLNCILLFTTLWAHMFS